MELSIFIASNAQLLSPRNTLFHAAHVDHLSKATVCSYQHCLPCAVTILETTLSVETISMYTVLKIGMFGIQGITFTYL